MAKGFKVVTQPPTSSGGGTDDFNLEEAKKMIKDKSVVFCLPGRGVSYTSIKKFIQLCFDLVQINFLGTAN